MYHLVTAKVSREGKKGSTEKYLTASHSVTESEAIVASEFDGVMNTQVDVLSSKRIELSGFLKTENRNQDDPFDKTYIVTVKVVIEDDGDKQKSVREKYLVEASNEIIASNMVTQIYRESTMPIDILKIENSGFNDVLYRENNVIHTV